MALEVQLLARQVLSMIDFFCPTKEKKEEWLRKLIEALTASLKKNSCHLDQTDFCHYTPRQRYIELLHGLGSFVEQRDPYTRFHLNRTKTYIQLVLEEIKEIDQAQKQRIGEASELHDIGKAVTPDSVLLKPGSLTPDEWRVMREHTIYGDQLLSNYHIGNGYLQTARQIARSHHENYDGSGYPDSLSGVAIPIAAAIVHIADVFDAFTSSRVYRKKITPKKAFEWITQGSDDGRTKPNHFHPDVLRAFECSADKLMAACLSFAQKK